MDEVDNLDAIIREAARVTRIETLRGLALMMHLGVCLDVFAIEEMIAEIERATGLITEGSTR